MRPGRFGRGINQLSPGNDQFSSGGCGGDGIDTSFVAADRLKRAIFSGLPHKQILSGIIPAATGKDCFPISRQAGLRQPFIRELGGVEDLALREVNQGKLV